MISNELRGEQSSLAVLVLEFWLLVLRMDSIDGMWVLGEAVPPDGLHAKKGVKRSV